jgi:TPR repeat protein
MVETDHQSRQIGSEANSLVEPPCLAQGNGLFFRSNAFLQVFFWTWRTSKLWRSFEVVQKGRRTGLAFAQLNLAAMYKKGEGVLQNYVKVYAHYSVRCLIE